VEYRYTAIALKKKEIGETDRLYTFLTREGGKIRAKAVGVRKPHARLASSLETLMLSDVTVVRGRGMGRIAGAITEEAYLALRSDFDALSLAIEAADIVDSLVGLEQPDERIFTLFFEYLSLLDQLVGDEGNEQSAALVSEGFYVKLLSELGYHLETSMCAVSGDRLESEGICFFSPDAGGIVLADHADRHSIAVSGNAVKLLRIFLGNRLGSLRKIRVSRADIEELGRMRKLFLRHILR
jgi:DNA repair protein RecO (recombination protein O)